MQTFSPNFHLNNLRHNTQNLNKCQNVPQTSQNIEVSHYSTECLNVSCRGLCNLFDELFGLEKFSEVEDLPCGQT